jgi:1,4-alpha-glucan branching enzyme
MLKKKYFKTNDDCEVTFEYADGNAQEVALVTDFHDWKPLPMKKAAKNGGPFRIKIRLPKENEIQFRYFVNQDIWVNDPGADAFWANEYGDSNGVVNTYAGN